MENISHNIKNKKPNYGKQNRQKGHSTERLYAKEFRELGYDKCVTSRQGSRLHDDAGIDLIFVPFNIQIKAGKQRGLNPITELKSMEQKIKERFPETNPELSQPNMVILKKEVGRGIKRSKYDEVVIMAFEDFKDFIRKK
jgi:hypothetical protein